MPTFKTAYGENPRQKFATRGPSLTHQSEAGQCDINGIMKKFEKTGVIEHLNSFGGQYADFTNTPQDYQTSMNTVIEAENMFLTLPASLRRRFQNDPGLYLDFVGNPANSEELVRLGLATLRQEGDVLVDGPTPIKKLKAPDTPPKAPLKAPLKTSKEPEGDDKK